MLLEHVTRISYPLPLPPRRPPRGTTTQNFTDKTGQRKDKVGGWKYLAPPFISFILDTVSQVRSFDFTHVTLRSSSLLSSSRRRNGGFDDCITRCTRVLSRSHWFCLVTPFLSLTNTPRVRAHLLPPEHAHRHTDVLCSSREARCSQTGSTSFETADWWIITDSTLRSDKFRRQLHSNLPGSYTIMQAGLATDWH